MSKRMVIIAYDISNNSRRRKVAQILGSYGYRMNYSVFECILSQKQITTLRTELKKLINIKEDSILFYPLDKISVSLRDYLGNASNLFTHFLNL